MTVVVSTYIVMILLSFFFRILIFSLQYALRNDDWCHQHDVCESERQEVKQVLIPLFGRFSKKCKLSSFSHIALPYTNIAY
jgi:hypothetical protein